MNLALSFAILISTILTVVILVILSEKPEYFGKVFSEISKFFNNLNKNNVDEDKKYNDLCAIEDIEEKECSKLFEWGLKKENVRNIAVTGPYGSGKSSFLKSFEKNHSEYNYLNISLASFDDNIKKDKEKLIEENILQQIIYKESANKFPNSRIKRIKELSFLRFFSNFCLVIIWVSSFYLKFGKPIWWNKIINLNDFKEFEIFQSIILICGIFYFAYSLARNFGINKIIIKALDNEIELGKSRETSIFYKHLDEIIYFFKKTKYDVVFFEDIDRFESINVELFTKLRELNGLINDSSDIGRNIRFVYAVKDDLFESEIEVEKSGKKEKIRKEDCHKLRTKFFDLIVPIIPVVDYSNSSEVMKTNICDNYLSKLINKNKCTDIRKRINNFCLYINDMRIINNISNEFKVYRENINGNLTTKIDDEKLLGYIVYKNLYPKDFSDLSEKKGMVYEALTNKNRIELELKKIPIKKLLMEKKGADIFDSKICKEGLLLDLLKEGIIDEDYSMYISFFEEEKRSDIEYIRAFRNGEDNLIDYKIDNPKLIIEEYLYEGDFERLGIINLYLIDYIFRNKSDYSLHFEKLIKFISKELENDFHFVKNILIIIDKEKDITIEKRSEQDFEYKKKKNIILKTFLREIKNLWGVIKVYCETMSVGYEKYLYLILDKCNNGEMINSKEELAKSINRNNNFLSSLEVEFLNYMKEIKGHEQRLKLWVTNVEKNLVYLDVKIEKLDAKENNSIFNILYSNNLYKISLENINNIIGVKCSLSEEEKALLETQMYTLITNKKDELKELTEYIDNNIQEFVNNVILIENSKVQESEEALIELFTLPNEKLGLEVKKNLIISQNTKFMNIQEIPQDLWSKSFEKNKVYPTWENVLRYFEYCEENIDEALEKYFNTSKNSMDLSKVSLEGFKVNNTSDLAYKLDTEIVMCKEIKEENFNMLINSLYSWNEIQKTENIIDIRIATMINNKKLNLTRENIEELLQNHESRVINLLLVHKDEFIKNSMEKMDYRETNQKEIYSQFFSHINHEEKIKFINNFYLNELDIRDKLWNQINEFIGILENFGLDKEFDKEKVKELMECDFLPITSETFELLEEIISSSHVSEGILRSKKEELLTKMKELDLKEDFCRSLYDVLRTPEEKIQFVNNISLDNLNKNSDLVEEIIDYISSEKFKVNFDVVRKLISISEDNVKLDLFLNQMEFLENSEIKMILKLLDGNYKKIVTNPKKCNFDKEVIDIVVLEKLKLKGILSSVNESNGRIYISKSEDLKW